MNQHYSMADIVSRLVSECNSAQARGSDFPTVWRTVLRPHAYVAGLPVQGRDGNGPFLKIPLITGHFIISDAAGFRLD
jgi:hypothetical protein